MKIGNKGFTFAQIAAMLLVLVGLVAFIVLTTSQIGKAGGASSGITDSVSTASEALPTACEIAGGICYADSDCVRASNPTLIGYLRSSKINYGDLGCSDAQKCCKG